eukprot:358776-Chlamydomonas_euryale.AAC.1
MRPCALGRPAVAAGGGCVRGRWGGRRGRPADDQSVGFWGAFWGNVHDCRARVCAGCPIVGVVGWVGALEQHARRGHRRLGGATSVATGGWGSNFSGHRRLGGGTSVATGGWGEQLQWPQAAGGGGTSVATGGWGRRNFSGHRRLGEGEEELQCPFQRCMLLHAAAVLLRPQRGAKQEGVFMSLMAAKPCLVRRAGASMMPAPAVSRKVPVGMVLRGCCIARFLNELRLCAHLFVCEREVGGRSLCVRGSPGEAPCV